MAKKNSVDVFDERREATLAHLKDVGGANVLHRLRDVAEVSPEALFAACLEEAGRAQAAASCQFSRAEIGALAELLRSERGEVSDEDLHDDALMEVRVDRLQAKNALVELSRLASRLLAKDALAVVIGHLSAISKLIGENTDESRDVALFRMRLVPAFAKASGKLPKDDE